MKIVPLEEICEIQVGKTPARANPLYWGVGNPWLSIADMNGKIFIEKTKEEITDQAVSDCNCRLIPKDTVLFSFKLSIGKVGITKIPMHTNEAIAALIIKDPKTVLTKFLYYAMSSSDFSRGSNRAVMGKTLNKAQLRKLPIPLPSFDEQGRIVSILDQADALRRKRRESMKLLDEYVQSVFMEMFGDPMTNPKGWDRHPIGNVADVKIGPFGSLLHKHDYVQNGIPLVNPKHLIDMRIQTDAGNSITPEKMQELLQYRLKKGDVVLGRRGEIGRCGLVTDKEDGYLCGTGSMFIRSNGLLDPVFLAYLIATPQMSAALEDKAVGITMKNLNAGAVAGFVVLVPPIETQVKWSSTVQRKNQMIEAMQKQSDEMENYFSAIMQQSFAGAI